MEKRFVFSSDEFGNEILSEETDRQTVNSIMSDRQEFSIRFLSDNLRKAK
jgi:hypothetical protein